MRQAIISIIFLSALGACTASEVFDETAPRTADVNTIIQAEKTSAEATNEPLKTSAAVAEYSKDKHEDAVPEFAKDDSADMALTKTLIFAMDKQKYNEKMKELEKKEAEIDTKTQTPAPSVSLPAATPVPALRQPNKELPPPPDEGLGKANKANLMADAPKHQVSAKLHESNADKAEPMIKTPTPAPSVSGSVPTPIPALQPIPLPTSTATPIPSTVTPVPPTVTPTPSPKAKPTPTKKIPSDDSSQINQIEDLIVDDFNISSVPKYDRDHWSHWKDYNGDCVNTRHEVLIEESVAPVKFDGACKVSTGEWHDPYSGRVFYEAKSLDVDHFIPLYNAHNSGGWKWDKDKKATYANFMTDPDHLIAVQSSVNRSKGADGPDQWKPPDKTYWCEYATDWIRIKKTWDLSVTTSESNALNEMLATCNGVISANREPIKIPSNETAKSEVSEDLPSLFDSQWPDRD